MCTTIHILLPVHNRREITRRFIDCLKSQTYLNYQLILIDDGSIDGTAEMVRESIYALTVITGWGNWWWAGALQQGYQWLKNHDIPANDLVLIINDDTEFEIDFLKNAVDAMKSNSRKLLLAKTFDLATQDLYEVGVRVDWRNLTFERLLSEEGITCFSTRGLFFRMEDMLVIGGFYSKILPHYLSDYEFTIRAVRKGFTLTTDDKVRLFVNNETTGYHLSKVTSIHEFINNYFSIKSSSYILSWTSFILLSSPIKYIPINLLKVWGWAFMTLLRLQYSKH